MALPSLLTNLLDKNGSSLQQMAFLAYLKNGEESKPYLQAITAANVYNNAYKSFSKNDEIDAARNEAILNIAKYVKEHPRARQSEIQQKVEEEINIFKLKIATLT